MSMTRRSLLQTAAAAVATAPFAAWAQEKKGGGGGVKLPVSGVLGLELYSLRDWLAKDVDAALAQVRDWGFREVEVAGFPEKMTAKEIRAALDKAGLKAASQLISYERLRDETDKAIADAKTLGVKYLGTAWIPHQKGQFDVATAKKAAQDFSKWAPEVRKAGLQGFYHLHGFEFGKSPDGTVLDTLMKATPESLEYEMDVFWVVHGGGDPVALFQKYPKRFSLVHLKDMAKGTKTGLLTGEAPHTTNVPLGTGMIEWPKVLRAAEQAGVKYYFIEDEHPEAAKQIPQTLEYLRDLEVPRT